MLTTLKTPDGFELAADHIAAGTDKAIIFAHGMTVDREDEGIFVRAEKELNALGFSTIRFDFRAHGESSGSSATDFTISGELTDVDTAVSFLRAEGHTSIGLAGASFGGGVSALYAGMHPDSIDKLFLVNPVLDYDKCFLHPSAPWGKQYFSDVVARVKKEGVIRVGSRQFVIGPQLIAEMSQYFPYQELARYDHPLLVVHGTADTKVSYQDTHDIFEHLPNRLKNFISVEGSEHGFHEEPFETQVIKLLVEFFR